MPVGGRYSLGGKEAKDVIDQVEPKIILPMHYKIKGSKFQGDDEKVFCKEIGTCPREKLGKLVIRKKDLEDKKTEVVLMEAVNA